MHVPIVPEPLMYGIKYGGGFKRHKAFGHVPTLHLQVLQAVQALREYVAQEKKKTLVAAMNEALPIQLQFTLKKVPPQAQKINVKM